MNINLYDERERRMRVGRVVGGGGGYSDNPIFLFVNNKVLTKELSLCH